MEWKLATESKPKRYERVLLKIRHEDFPVVGFWGERKWDICTVNILGSGVRWQLHPESSDPLCTHHRYAGG